MQRNANMRYKKREGKEGGKAAQDSRITGQKPCFRRLKINAVCLLCSLGIRAVTRVQEAVGGRPAASVGGGTCHVILPPRPVAAGPTTRRFPFSSSAEFRSGTCRLRQWRHVTRVAWGTCRHCIFDISFVGWSFLTIHSPGWSLL